MIEWPIRACIAAPEVGEVIVSTEDEEIASVALDAGASRIVDRPIDLASDLAGTGPVVRHSIGELGLPSDALVMCIYPTAAVLSEQIERAVVIARENPSDFVVTVGRHRSPLERALRPIEGNRMGLISAKHRLFRTQDLPQSYFDAGKIYLAAASLWQQRETMMEESFIPYHLPDWAALDIDEPADWEVAEGLHQLFILDKS